MTKNRRMTPVTYVGKKQAEITFQPEGKRGIFPPGTTIMNAAKEVGIDIKSICGGKLICGKCKVVIKKGMENISQVTEDERRLLGREKADENCRLACAAKFYGDIVAYVPEETRGEKRIVFKEGMELPVKVEPSIKKYYLEMKEPDLEDDLGDFERILNVLERDYNIKEIDVDHEVLQKIPNVLREKGWKCTVSIWNDRELVDIEDGYKAEEAYGLAVDIGTTTVVGYLTDLIKGDVLATDSILNPQIAYGEDVISRITFAMQEANGLEKLNKKIVSGLNEILKNVCKRAGVSSARIGEVTVAGNTGMHHVFLKIDPRYIATAPYVPALHKSQDVKAKNLGLNISEGGYVHTLPIEGGWVGADNVAFLILSEPYKKDEMHLLIDIGANGEIVLGNREKLISCSAAAGPAPEGGHIKHGMRAAVGSIERIRINPETYEPSYNTIGGAPPRGICGSGVIDVVAELFRTKMVREDGRLNLDIDTPRIRKTDGILEYVIAWADEASIARDIVITQKDVREVQLAKGAISAGAHILMDEMDVDEIERVVMAGSFGNYIDKLSSLMIGLIPEVPPDRIVQVGNAAGSGARIALISRKKREEADEIVKRIKHVKLSAHSDFKEEFMKATFLPHMEEERYPNFDEIIRSR